MSNLDKRPLQTLFMSQEHLKSALKLTTDLLNSSTIKKDTDGLCSIDELCEKLKSLDPHLYYINRNHVVELYFKDSERKIFICGYDGIKYKEIRYVQPPDILYFGTIERLVERMKKSGIKSMTKGYLKLYSTPEGAVEFAGKFVSNPADKIVVLAINAIAAFTSGMKFSTFKPNEYIVVRLDSKFIKEPVVND